jgi:hypothetical protein
MRSFRHTPRPSPSRLQVRLTFEALDSRLSPSSLVFDPILYSPTDPVQSGGVETGSQSVSLTPNAAPRVVNFTAVEIVGGLWRFTGDVIDEAPGGLTITFGGEPDSLQGVTTTTDANGHFDIVLELNTDGSDNGLASAQTVDAGGRASNVALYNINPG